MEAMGLNPTSDSHVLRYFPNAYSLISIVSFPHVSAAFRVVRMAERSNGARLKVY